MWHDHFATSNLKVDDLAAMRRQNETLRSLGRGPFGDAAARDAPRPGPAGLARRPGEPQGATQREPRPRADGAVHARRRPLHRGRRQGGRPGPDRLDGRRKDGSSSVPDRHDEGDEDDPRPDGRGSTPTSSPTSARAARHVRPAGLAALRRRSSARASPTTRPRARSPSGLRAHDLDIGWGVATSSGRGSSSRDANLHARVSDPVEFVVGSARALEMFDPPPSTLVLADWSGAAGPGPVLPAQRRRLARRPGLALGPRGRGRANFAAALVAGRARLRRDPARPARPLAARDEPADPGGPVRRSSASCSTGRRPSIGPRVEASANCAPADARVPRSPSA